MNKGKLYFIVDDDADDQELFIEALEGIDDSCTCITAFNGKDALQKLGTAMPQMPDFIFLDLNMPLMNGRQFLREIKNTELVKDIPVIIYSTSTDTKDVVDTIEMGAVYFLHKPNRFEDLSKALANIISHKWK